VNNPSFHIGPGRPASTSQRKEVIPKRVRKQSKKRKASKSVNDNSQKVQKKKFAKTKES